MIKFSQLGDLFLNYFAYGSNMLSERLVRRVGSIRDKKVGYLNGYTLKFNKWSRDGSGKANIVPDESGKVWGVLYGMNEEQLAILDRYEYGYSRKLMTVETKAGKKKAVAYIADEAPNEKSPYDWYLNFLVRGAEENHIPDDELERLKNTQNQIDPEETRRNENYLIAETTGENAE